MPRNSSGVYTLPQSPFVAGTAILSSAVNSNFSDIASALTGSLATDGSATMTGPIKATDGAVGAPGITFSSATTCGFYYVGVNQIGYSAAGVLSLTFNADGTITFLKAVTFSASVSFTDATFPSAVTFSATATFNGKVVVTSALNVSGTATFSGTTTFSGDVILSSGSPIATACRLALSGGNLVLSRYNGTSINIDGTNQSIPGAGVSLSASGVSASTFYYIYVYMNSGTMTLEYSTTAYTVNSTTGIPQKSGDSTRTLVGAAYTTAGSAWADADGTRYVLSYFNRRRRSSTTTFSANVSSQAGAPTIVEVDSSIRNGFISWSDEIVDISMFGSIYYPSGGPILVLGIGIDATNAFVKNCLIYTNAALYAYETVRYEASGLTENAAHYATINQACNTITATIYGGAVTLGAVSPARGPGSSIVLTYMG